MGSLAAMSENGGIPSFDGEDYEKPWDWRVGTPCVQNPYRYDAICQAHDVRQNVIIFGSLVNVCKEVCRILVLQSLLVLAPLHSIAAVAPDVHVVLLTSGQLL